MTDGRLAGIVAVLASLCLYAPALAVSSPAMNEAMSYDGLEKVSVPGIELAYARPGVSFVGYTKVLLEPVEVDFAKNWAAQRGPGGKLSTAEIESIRSGVAKIVYDEFVKALQAKGGYNMVTAPGPDVLSVKADILNLYVTAPGAPKGGRSRIYTVSPGQMTIVAQLSDSETGQLLARAIDRSVARSSSGPMQLTNSAVNAQEARAIASRWARILVGELDKARGIGRR